MTGRRLVLLVIAIYAVIGFSIYSDVLLNGEFMFDDFEYVVGNPIIQNLSFFKDMTDPRHIGYLSFALNFAADGERPFGFHLVNVIIHILNAILVFSLIRTVLRIIGPEEGAAGRRHAWVAFFAGLIFLVHPVGTQAVSYITQRFTSLSSLFYLLGVWLYLTSRESFEKGTGGVRAYGPYAASVISTVLAMKTKEIAFTIPVVLGVFELLLFRGSVFGKRRFNYLILPLASLVIIPLSLFGPEWGLIDAGTGVDEITRKDKLYDLYERSGYEYLITQFRVIVTYIRLLIFPVGQKVVYDFRASHSLWEPEVVLSLVFLLCVAWSGVYFWRKAGRSEPEDAADYKVVSMGIIWFFITLSIESSVIPIKDIIFEHRAYLPSVGFFGACSVLLMRAARKVSIGGVTARAAAVVLLVAVPLAAGTYMRNEIWTDEIKFWDDVVKKTGKAIGYNNRGNAYGKAGQYDLALRDLDKTISSFPTTQSERMAWENADFTPMNMAKTYMNRGQIYMALGDRVKAEEDFDRAKQAMVMPLDVKETLKRADLYSTRGAYTEAIEEYSRVLDWDPANIDALNDRGNAYSRSGRYNEAIADFNSAILMKPDFHLAYHNRGIAYAWSGKREKALDDFTTACGMGFGPACDSVGVVKNDGKRRDGLK